MQLNLELLFQRLEFVRTFREELVCIVIPNYIYQHNHIAINFRFMERAPKKMTVAEIEKKLGYKIEIVSDK